MRSVVLAFSIVCSVPIVYMVLHGSTGNICETNSKKWRVVVIFSSYRMQKFLVLVGLYGAIGFIVSNAVGDMSRGFGLTTVGCIMLYAVAVELTK